MPDSKILPEAMRIRAVLHVKEGERLTEVRVLMPHPMDTGQVKAPNGQVIPIWHITQVFVWHDNTLVLSSNFGSAVSKNPYLYFKFKGGIQGDTVRVAWVDNLGNTRKDSALIL